MALETFAKERLKRMQETASKIVPASKEAKSKVNLDKIYVPEYNRSAKKQK